MLQVWTHSRTRWTTFSPSTRVRTSQLKRRSTRTSPVLQTQTTFSLSSTPSLMSSSLTTCASVVFTNSQWRPALSQPHNTRICDLMSLFYTFNCLYWCPSGRLMFFYEVGTGSYLVISQSCFFFLIYVLNLNSTIDFRYIVTNMWFGCPSWCVRERSGDILRKIGAKLPLLATFILVTELEDSDLSFCPYCTVCRLMIPD